MESLEIVFTIIHHAYSPSSIRLKPQLLRNLLTNLWNTITKSYTYMGNLPLHLKCHVFVKWFCCLLTSISWIFQYIGIPMFFNNYFNLSKECTGTCSESCVVEYIWASLSFFICGCGYHLLGFACYTSYKFMWWFVTLWSKFLCKHIYKLLIWLQKKALGNKY